MTFASRSHEILDQLRGRIARYPQQKTCTIRRLLTRNSLDETCDNLVVANRVSWPRETIGPGCTLISLNEIPFSLLQRNLGNGPGPRLCRSEILQIGQSPTGD